MQCVGNAVSRSDALVALVGICVAFICNHFQRLTCLIPLLLDVHRSSRLAWTLHVGAPGHQCIGKLSTSEMVALQCRCGAHKTGNNLEWLVVIFGGKLHHTIAASREVRQGNDTSIAASQAPAQMRLLDTSTDGYKSSQGPVYRMTRQGGLLTYKPALA